MSAARRLALGFALVVAGASVVSAQQPQQPQTQQPQPSAVKIVPAAPAAKQASLQKFTGVWIEGPGYDITYGKDYQACEQRCLAATKCVMVEYYLPEKKCNMYDTARPRVKGGSSIVGVRG